MLGRKFMQVNKINSTPFGSGYLKIDSCTKIDAESIDKIEAGYHDDVTYIYYFGLGSREISAPLEKVLAGYTAAMVAPEGTVIDISQ